MILTHFQLGLQYRETDLTGSDEHETGCGVWNQNNSFCDAACDREKHSRVRRDLSARHPTVLSRRSLSWKTCLRESVRVTESFEEFLAE